MTKACPEVRVSTGNTRFTGSVPCSRQVKNDRAAGHIHVRDSPAVGAHKLIVVFAGASSHVNFDGCKARLKPGCRLKACPPLANVQTPADGHGGCRVLTFWLGS